MKRCLSLIFAAIALMGFTHRGSVWPNPVGTNWSTLGIVADSSTDNTAALNALPTDTTIIGDCPAGGTINYSGQWLLKSSLTIYQRPECWLKCSYTNANLNNSCITQSDLTTPITNVYYWGLQFEKPNLTYTNRNVTLWVDHLTLLYSKMDTYHQAFYIRGSDQEFGWCSSTNPVRAVGADYIRHFGNVPLVATTSGRPANVWIHNCTADCGDACYQIGQPFTIYNWANTNTDGVLVENSIGNSSSSNLLLVGEPGSNDPGNNNYYITNVTARNLIGSGPQSAVRIAQTVGNAQAFSNILLQNITLDGSANLSSSDGLFNLDSSQSTSPLNNVTLDGVIAKNVYKRSLVIDGVYNNITVENSTFPSQRASDLPDVYIGQFVSNIILQNNLIGSNVSTGVVVGAGANVSNSASTPSITGNTISNLGNNQSGVLLKAVSNASIIGNTVTQAGGATNVHALTLSVNGSTPGTNNSTATGNNFSGVSGTTQVICALGQGNVVSGNTGAVDCSP